MKRFQQFFGATLLTSLYAVSTFAGNMGFPAAAPQQLDATTEVFINVLQNIFLMF